MEIIDTFSQLDQKFIEVGQTTQRTSKIITPFPIKISQAIEQTMGSDVKAIELTRYFSRFNILLKETKRNFSPLIRTFTMLNQKTQRSSKLMTPFLNTISQAIEQTTGSKIKEGPKTLEESGLQFEKRRLPVYRSKSGDIKYGHRWMPIYEGEEYPELAIYRHFPPPPARKKILREIEQIKEIQNIHAFFSEITNSFQKVIEVAKEEDIPALVEDREYLDSLKIFPRRQAGIGKEIYEEPSESKRPKIFPRKEGKKEKNGEKIFNFEINIKADTITDAQLIDRIRSEIIRTLQEQVQMR